MQETRLLEDFRATARIDRHPGRRANLGTASGQVCDGNCERLIFNYNLSAANRAQASREISSTPQMEYNSSLASFVRESFFELWT